MLTPTTLPDSSISTKFWTPDAEKAFRTDIRLCPYAQVPAKSQFIEEVDAASDFDAGAMLLPAVG